MPGRSLVLVVRKSGSALLGMVVVVSLLGAALVAQPAAAARYRRLPKHNDSWFWLLDPPRAGVPGLPSMTALYPHPGSAKIWDTDLFQDSNWSHGQRLRIPTGRSPVVKALHATGHYSVCYVEAGAYQTTYPDRRDFAAADYGHRRKRYRMRGYPNEWWFNITGFRNYVAGHRSTLKGAARNIAAGLAKRFHWCKLEGQDAVEADDIDGYTNRGATGIRGGGWHLTKADAAGFERWIAWRAHRDGLAVLQKNDAVHARVDAKLFDGALSEECNYYHDPCAGRGGDWNAYLRRGKPVIDAEYVQDGETTAKFCAADRRWGIWGALFSVNLSSGSPYAVCWNRARRL